MGKQKYSIDFKLQVVGKYEQGKCGYKRLAREFNLPRDTVRDWCLNPKLHDATDMAKKTKINNEEKDLEYYKTAALFWETYAKNVEAEIAKQGKKKLVLKTMEDCLAKEPETKTRKLCEAAGVSKSAFYYSRKHNGQKSGDAEVISLIKKLPKRTQLRGGSKTKTQKIRQLLGVAVNHKRMARICRENGLLAKNRRRKFPKDYYSQQKENLKDLPKNILNRDFGSAEPYRKMCTDVSYFKTSGGWLYLSTVMDLHGRKIICHAVSRNNDEALADDTLDRLFPILLLTGGLLHSDQGVLYTSKKWRRRLAEKGIVQSMSRRGNCSR